ncbi:MAG: hypothetical protein M3O02_11890 [Acidobacteriota bacterium]|nr:hypothetical protein [Acidobacteriota bacterium]
MAAALGVAFLFAAALGQPTAVRHLQTPSYRITITEFCPMDFDCAHVTYQGVSNSGKAITLHGAHIWHDCPGTHDPCHPIGYRFKNGGIVYLVTEDGSLLVTQGTKYLVQEKGTWDDK